MQTDIIIIGPGAIGTFLALKFAGAGLVTGLVARNRRADILTRDGAVLVTSEGQRLHARLPVSQDVGDFFPGRLIFLCTKAQDIAATLEGLKERSGSFDVIVTLQNGVEAPHEVHKVLPFANIVAARVHGFFQMDGDAVRHVGVAPSIALGPAAGTPLRAAEAVSSVLARADIESSRHIDIAKHMWAKFVLAASVGGVGLALGRPAGNIMSDATGRTFLRDAMSEIAALAKARGINLPVNCVDQTLAFVSTFPPDATSSLQRDVEAGRASEYDALVGSVSRLGRATGMTTATFDRVEDAIRARGLRA